MTFKKLFNDLCRYKLSLSEIEKIETLMKFKRKIRYKEIKNAD